MTERIDILVQERGARTVSRSLSDVGGSAAGSARLVQLLIRAITSLGAIQLIRGLVRLADTFTNIQNRLRTVTDGSAELGAVTNELFAIAQRTRSEFESTAEVYARVGLATRELGISQRETLQFTESLNQAVILSGASTQEAAAGLLQLSQGLASGTLRGDELRSVLEQLPVVADVIAESLGVTRGELRQLGTDGQITADIVLRAFREARGELADRFGESVPTVSQAFVVLRNSVIQAVGGLDRATGASNFLARAILALADVVTDVGAVLTVVFEDVGSVIGAIGEIAAEAFGRLPTEAQNAASGINLSFSGLLRAIASIVDGIVGIFFGGFLAITAAARNGASGIQQVFVSAFNGISQQFTNLANTIISGLNLFRDEQIAPLEAFRVEDVNVDAAEEISAAFNRGRESATLARDAVDGFLERVDAVGESDANVDLDAVGERLARIGQNAEAAARGTRDLQDELENTFEAGLQDGIDRLIARSEEFGEAISDNVVGAFDALSDEIVSLARDGEFSFRRLFGTISEQLLRLATNQLFSQLLGGFGSSAGGIGSLFGIFGGARQAGGPVNPRQAFTVGESGTELFVPPGVGRIVPAPQTRQIMQQQQQPTVVQAPAPNVQVNIGAAPIADALSGREGEELVLDIVSANPRAFNGALDRGTS